jgi:inner membrane protein YidH
MDPDPARLAVAPKEPSALQDSAPRRTWLAAERTYLAWLRTALAALALAVGVGRLLPALVAGSHKAFGLVGAAYGLLGILVLLLGAWRTQRVRSALIANRPLPTDDWTLWVLTVLGVVLAVATIALVIVEV